MQRQPQHRLRNVGSFMVFERGNKRARSRESKENRWDVEELAILALGLSGMGVMRT